MEQFCEVSHKILVSMINGDHKQVIKLAWPYRKNKDALDVIKRSVFLLRTDRKRTDLINKAS